MFENVDGRTDAGRTDARVTGILLAHPRAFGSGELTTKVLKTSGSLMKVESIAKCSLGAFCNTFDLHQAIISLEKTIFGLLLSGRLRQVLLYFPN